MVEEKGDAVQIVRGCIAIGDGVEGVRRRPVEAEGFRQRVAVDVESQRDASGVSVGSRAGGATRLAS